MHVLFYRSEDVKIGCEVDVTHLLHGKCSGRRSCDVEVPDRDLDATNPCGEMQNYLFVTYICVPGRFICPCPHSPVSVQFCLVGRCV